MSRKNSPESKKARREERERKDAERISAKIKEWNYFKPGPVAVSVMSAFLRKYDAVSGKVPVDSLFTILAFPDDVKSLTSLLDDRRKECGFMEYAVMQCDAGDGRTVDVVFIMTMSECGENNYRALLHGCRTCAPRSIFDFFNSRLGFDESSYKKEIGIAPEGKVVSSSLEVKDGDDYIDSFMDSAHIKEKGVLMVEPWHFIFKRSEDGVYSPIMDVGEYNHEVQKINSIMASKFR